MEWNKVENNLPSVYETVLVFVNASNYQGVHMAWNKKGKLEVLDESGNHNDFITHWQKLPEPPK